MLISLSLIMIKCEWLLHVLKLVFMDGFYSIQSLFLFRRCILVDENDRVVGHDTKYNCK